MTTATRRAWLASLLAGSVAAALFVSRQPEEPIVAEPSERVIRSDANRQGQSAPPRLSKLVRPSMEAGEANPFSPKSWYVPPPPPVVKNEKPSAPPLPFTYRGNVGQEDRPLFYLAKGEESFVVSIGDTFAGTYRLESARNGVLAIKYLPLSEVQTLRYSSDL